MARPVPLPVVVADDDGMYRSAAKVYPREIDGRFQRLRHAAVFGLLGIYYLFPWLNWNSRQAVLFDLPARKFFIFGLEFWPQDFIYLSWLLIMAGLALFFFTALAGRLWCGYACPQTVWTEVFLWIERWTEGNHLQRRKLDASPWTREKILRKGGKQLLWIGFALWTGFTFVGFFTPVRELAARLPDFSFGPWETFWSLFYGLATYGNAGYLREQVCKYMCPYARFQGAMFDRNTLLIAYDARRGEPRGPRRRGVDHRARGLGDCVDCTVCVQVCPTGIDIRDGLQYECIACGACIDACDAVMDRLGYPRGLIRHATPESIEGRRAQVLRPRVLVYFGLLALLFGAFVWSITQRVPLIVDVVRDRNALYRTVGDGGIENVYTLRILNKEAASHRYRVVIEDHAAVRLAAGAVEIDAGPGAVVSLPVTLRAAAGAVSGRADVTFVVAAIDRPAIRYRQSSRFFGPSP